MSDTSRTRSVLLFSDLDNTLIYSYRREIGAARVPVEWLDGREISYMTPFAYARLRALNQRLPVIPVSTRSVTQYRRIDLGFTPALALVSNGGTLLTDGREDEAWHAETQARIAPCMPMLRDAARLLERDPRRSFELRMVDHCFLFTKSDDPAATLEMLSENADGTQLNFHRNGAKVYVLPRPLHKGNAVKRLLKKTEPPHARAIAAGDSEFDLPMLRGADEAYCPAALAADLPGANFPEAGEPLSDFLLKRLGKQFL